ncbi:MAG: NAD(P)-dependent oxidoreductase [Flavihumibacter sp. CACIAM 22H1]|nr:MAG: NAD(P)-dependent oxidoreductase [Flavihumibacter sp. CACIAM 22H1]
MPVKNPKKAVHPPQQQARPGRHEKMKPVPETNPISRGSNMLKGKNVLITGGDSGIGKAVAKLFALEGANIAIAYLSETDDASETCAEVKDYGVDCLLIKTDLSKEANCRKTVQKTVRQFGSIDILINNIALHWEQKSLTDIITDQLIKTFTTNVYSYFWTTRYALEHMKKGACIINSSSVTAYRGSDSLIDYAATKAAIIGFTRSLAANLVMKGIRVNAVAPGPIWTPLIVSSFRKEKVAAFGSDAPMKRPGQPNEIAPSYLFLALEENSYMTRQVLHPNGGEIVNA